MLLWKTSFFQAFQAPQLLSSKVAQSFGLKIWLKNKEPPIRPSFSVPRKWYVIMAFGPYFKELFHWSATILLQDSETYAAILSFWTSSSIKILLKTLLYSSRAGFLGLWQQGIDWWSLLLKCMQIPIIIDQLKNTTGSTYFLGLTQN